MRTPPLTKNALPRLGVLLAASVILFPSFANAQVTAEQGSNIRTSVLGAVGNPTQIEGLPACTTGAVADLIRNSGVTSQIGTAARAALAGIGINGGCGERATASGSLPGYSQVSFNSGDTLKCTFHTLGQPSCVVTRASGGQFFFSDFFFGGNQSATFNAQGEFVGGEEQSVGGEVGQSALDFAEDAATLAIRAVASLILWFASWLLGIAGTLLNWVMVKAVFEFSLLIGNSPGLLLAWSILRDIGNMVLLFGFIFMGIATILNIDKFAVKKAFPRLILFAILMNFSLFAAEAVIDASNGLTATLYNQANANPCATDVEAGTGELTQEQCSVNYGLAGHIMQNTGLSGIYAVDDSTGFLPNAAAMIGLALFATIGCVVLFATAFMLVTRAVVLTFIMITAPIGFAGMAIPPFEKYAKEWWSRLIHQAFFAPILILLIFLSLKITSTFTESMTTRNSLAAAVTHPESSVMGIILIFFLVIGFLIGSLVAAKKFGAMGAEVAVNGASKFAFGGMNLAMSGTALGARKAIQRTPGLNKSAAARAFTNMALRPVERGKLDMRRIPGMGSTLGMAGAKEGAKPKDTLKETQDRYRDFRKRMQDNRTAYDEEVDKVEVERNAKKPDGLTEKDKKFLAGLSTKELEEMKGIKKGVTELVENLSPEQFENLMKSEKLTDMEKGRIKNARFASLSETGLNAAVRRGTATDQLDAARKVLKNMSNSELESLPASMLDPGTAHGQLILAALSDPQRDHLAGSKKRTNEERARVKASTANARLEETFRTQGAAAAAALVRTLTPAQVAKLDKNILKQREIAQQLTAGQLKELQGKLNGADTLTIARHINAGGTPGARQYIGPGGVGSAYWS